MDFDPIPELDNHINKLGKLVESQALGQLTYHSDVQGAPGADLIMDRHIELEEEKLYLRGTFLIGWQSASTENYVTEEGTPLTILEFAKIWLDALFYAETGLYAKLDQEISTDNEVFMSFTIRYVERELIPVLQSFDVEVGANEIVTGAVENNFELYTNSEGELTPAAILELQESLKPQDIPDVFEQLWNSVNEYNYTNYETGEPLNVVVFATIWLSVVIYDERSVFTQAEIKPNVNNSEFIKFATLYLKRLVKDVIQTEGSDEIEFNIKEMIRSAIDLHLGRPNKLRAQKILVKTMQTLRGELEEPVELLTYDSVTTSITYAIPVRHISGNLAMSYTTGVEEVLFDDVIVSETIPVVILSTNTTKLGTNVLYKDSEQVKTFAPTVDHVQQYHDAGWFNDLPQQSIVFMVWTGSGAPNLAKPDMYKRMFYSFDKNMNFNSITVVEAKSDVLTRLKERLNQHLINFQLVQPETLDTHVREVKETFIIPNVILQRDIFLHLINTDHAAMSLMYLREDSTPWSLKSTYKFYLNTFGQLVIKAATNEQRAKIVSHNDALTPMFLNDKYLQVTITSEKFAYSRFTREFIRFIVQKYIREYDDFMNMYKLFFPSWQYLAPVDEEAANRKLEYDRRTDEDGKYLVRNIYQLRQVDPLMWSADSGYVRKAQVSVQVKVISEDEIPYYREQGLDVIKWPVPVEGLEARMQTQPTINMSTGRPIQNYYTPSDPNYPYIKLVASNGANKDAYPMYPKCIASRELLINYRDWSIKLLPKTKVNKHIGKTFKILPVGGKAKATGLITTLLQSDDIKRMGMYSSKSSFLHAVIFAIEALDNFRSYFDEPRAEDDVRLLRLELADYAHVCMQENPYKTVEQVADEIRNPDVFFDPRLYYRAVEELWQINVFCFASCGTDKEMIMDLPNYQTKYARLRRTNRDQNVVVFRMVPNEASVEDTDQCQLMGTEVDNQIFYVYGESVLERLESMMLSMTRVLEVQSVVTDKPRLRVLNSNLEYREISDTLLNKVTSQFLTNEGRVRGLTLKIGDQEISLIVEGIQPLNIPEIQAPITADLEMFEALTEMFKDSISNVRYTPDLQTADKPSATLAGVWLVIDGLEAYVPLNPQSWDDTRFQPVRYDIPYRTEQQESPTKRLIRLQRVTVIFIQLLKRLYVLSRLSPLEFIDQHTEVHRQYYTVQNSSMYIPLSVRNSFTKFLQHCQTTFPNLFYNGKLAMDSDEMQVAALSRLMHLQDRIDGELRNTISIKYPRGTSERIIGFPPHLEHFFQTSDDYTRHSPYQMVFMSLARLRMELEMSQGRQLTVVSEIDYVTSISTKPYALVIGGRLFLVQNVDMGDIKRAVLVAHYWRANKINLGYNVPAIDTDYSDVQDVPAGKLVVPKTDKALILVYSNQTYAALLPI